MAERERLDTVLTERGLADSRERAQALILGGAVTVSGMTSLKASTRIPYDAEIEVRSAGQQLASRGGHKLQAAFDAFDLTVAGKAAVDVGASTGGFTDVLLRHGARRVYAVDVGYGQLAWRLRNDQRVVVMERTNFRHVNALPETVQLATVDVSFISVGLILPVLSRVVASDGDAVLLVKPQFEAGKGNVGKGGVVRDPWIHHSVLLSVVGWAESAGWGVRNIVPSPLLGPAGNREFLVHLQRNSSNVDDLPLLIEAAIGRP